MNKFHVLLLTILSTFIFSSTALADSLYKQGTTYVGVLVANQSATGLTAANFGGEVGYFLSDNLSVSGSYESTGFYAQTATGNVITAMIDYHLPFGEKLGGFVGVGYGFLSTTGTGGGPAINNSGLAYEIGAELRFTDHFAFTGAIQAMNAYPVATTGASMTLNYNF